MKSDDALLAAWEETLARKGDAPAIFDTRDLKSGASSEITTSSKAMPATFMAIQGRNDHDE